MYFVSQRRLDRMRSVLQKRQDSLRLFMDYVYSAHNLSAIVRTCDAVNIGKLYYRHQKSVKLNNEITLGAHKWIFNEYIDDIKAFYKQIKEEGYQIVVSALSDDSIDFREVDYTKPTLIVVGNEVDGVSQTSLDAADKKVIIPMYGMSQSLNASVATAVILYEAQRQRQMAGMYDKPQLKEEVIEETIKKWAHDDLIEKMKQIAKARAKAKK